MQKGADRVSEDQFVDVEGVRTRYRAAGESGAPLVLIHGLGATLESWSLNLGPLARIHRVFALDLVWFGKSDRPERPVTGEYFSRFVARFAEAVGLERATLVGNSMGGLIALRTALEYPERVQGLVLVDPAGFGREISWLLRLRTVLAVSPRGRPSPRVLRWFLRQLAYDESTITDELIEVTQQVAEQPGALEWYQRVLEFGVNWRGLREEIVGQVRDAAHLLRVPTLIVWGKQDRVIPVAHAHVARARIAHAQVHLFDRCGHVPMIERAEEFNQLVTQFVKYRVPAYAAVSPARD